MNRHLVNDAVCVGSTSMMWELGHASNHEGGDTLCFVVCVFLLPFVRIRVPLLVLSLLSVLFGCCCGQV